MGTELVDIHFRIEKRFGVALPTDDEVLSFTTVGDIADAIAARVSAANRVTCVTLPAFLETRRFVGDFTHQPTRSLRPSTLIVAVVPSRERKTFWAALRTWYGSPPPSLRLTTATRWVYLALTLTAAYWATVHGWYGMVAAWFLIVALVAATRFLPHIPPAGFTTLWDVAKRRASVGAAIVTGIDEAGLFAALQHELSCALGVEKAEIRRETRLKEDLSVG